MGWRRNRVGLALGGGGARGLAHIGVLDVLEREKVPIDLLVGTSMGALVGACYASGATPEELVTRVEEYLNSPEFQSSAIKAFEAAHAKEDSGITKKIQSFLKNRVYMIQALFKPGLLSNEDFQFTIDFFVPDIQIEETRIPFRAVATDLVTGDQVVFSKGSLRQAVMASCAVPGAIEPLKDGEMLLSDGGIVCLVPTTVARAEGADIVIAVTVDRDTCSIDELDTIRAIYSRASEIMSERLRRYDLKKADVVVYPEVGELHWSGFSQAKNLIEEGEKATLKKIEKIHKTVHGFRKWFTLRKARNPKTHGAANPLPH